MSHSFTKGGSLTGRRVVITGAASGIGRATARLCLEEGAAVILMDRNAQAARETLGQGLGIVLEVDITDPEALSGTAATAADRFGGIDGIVNAAGIMVTGPVSDLSPEIWQKTIDVNLSGSFHVIRACLPHVDRTRDPAIVNIASAAGLLPNAPGLTAYAASKGGVIALTKALAAELAPEIRVNCLCPGMVDTPMAPGNGGNTRNYALRRMATPMEMARVLRFMLSSDASYMTGSVVAADGGRSFH